MRVRKPLTILLCVAFAGLIAGCAEQLIRDESTKQMREGDMEGALLTLQRGVARYPDSALLRAGMERTKDEAVAGLLSAASEHLQAGRFDQADQAVSRVLKLEPRNERAQKMQADIAAERKLAKTMAQAEALLAAGKAEPALELLEPALRATPRHGKLLALRQKAQLALESSAGARPRLALVESRPITLDFRAAPLPMVLEAITRFSGVNFVLDRDVRQDGRVTVFLRSAKVEDAIELVASSNQLAFRIIDPQTVLLYPNTADKQREHQEQVIRVFRLANSEAKATAAMLRTVLRLKEPYVDERANMVILRESPNIVAIAERLVALQDVGEPEVMMEVEVLEIKSTRLTELGINFPNSVSLTPLNSQGGTGLTVADARGLNATRIGVGVAGLLINLRRETGDVNILANPRIRAKNKEKARILIGDKVPVITSTSSATGFVSENVNYLEVGLKLDVEPVISPEDDVTLKMALEVSTIANEVRTGNGSLAYQIGTRNANTTLRLRDGETQLLGGLISNEDRSSASKIPGLGDLPLAGRLFSSQADNYARTELVLAITPHIMRSSATADLAQTEMWIGTENSTRLRAPPQLRMQQTAARSDSTGGLPGPNAAGIGGRAEIRGPAADAPSNTPPPPPPVRVSWELPASVKVGDEFTAKLVLESAVPVHAAPFEISFATSQLEAVEVTEGPFLKQDRQDSSFNQTVSPGKIAVGLLRNDPDGATGKGVALSVKFKARKAGPAEISLLSARPVGLNGLLATGPLPIGVIEVK